MTKKNPAAVALGRRGGAARAASLTAEERSDSARVAANAKWAALSAEERSKIMKARRAKGLRRKKRQR